jgi:hypothetical protein
MNNSELFDVIESHEGRWTIRHAITDEPAGSLLRTSQGLVLRDENDRFLGAFPSVEVALRNLYAVV